MRVSVLLTGNNYTKCETLLALLERLYFKDTESTEAKEIIARTSLDLIWLTERW
jgi:hypothetical protein